MLPATEEDARELASVLRVEDRLEVEALGLNAFEGLFQSLIGAQEAWTYRADGQIVCMAGVKPWSLIGRTGVPWLLGSGLVSKHRRSFMVETRRMVTHWLTLFDVLSNVVDVRYEAAIRWLLWLGFEIGPPFAVVNGRFCVVRKEV